jgi:hypothetical protein
MSTDEACWGFVVTKIVGRDLTVVIPRLCLVVVTREPNGINKCKVPALG